MEEQNGHTPTWHAAKDQTWRHDFMANHVDKLKHLMKKRKADVALRSIEADQTERDDGTSSATHVDELIYQCSRRPTDKYAGCARLRGIRALLTQIDQRGYERSPNQQSFHEAFIRACSRIMYREDWAVHRTEIMEHNKWKSTPSEVLISTPRSAPPPSLHLRPSIFYVHVNYSLHTQRKCPL